MRNGFNSYTRFSSFGFGLSNWFNLVSDFGGILELEVAAGGTFKVMWIDDPDAVRYNVYVRGDSEDIFHEEYLVGKFPNASYGYTKICTGDGIPIRFVKIRTEGDMNTLLQDSKMYYVGVRAEDQFGVEDNNELYLNLRPLGTGQSYVFVNDRHISIVS